MMLRMVSRYLRKRNLFKSLYYVGVLISVSFLFLRVTKTTGDQGVRSLIPLPSDLSDPSAGQAQGSDAAPAVAMPEDVADPQPVAQADPGLQPEIPNAEAAVALEQPPVNAPEAGLDTQKLNPDANPPSGLSIPNPGYPGVENVVVDQQALPAPPSPPEATNLEVPVEDVQADQGLPGMEDLDQQLSASQNEVKDEIVIISVICMGEDAAGSLWQKRQMNVLLKSMVWFPLKRHIQFHMFSDNPLFFAAAQAYIKTWPQEYQEKISFTSHDVWYPESMKSMKMTFRPCSSQRLFLPGLLPDISKAVYLDTDLIFFRPIDELWELMLDGVKPDFYGGFGPRMLEVTDKRLPYFGRREVNAGLFFMNLDKLRQFPGTWEGEVEKIFFSEDMRNILGRDPDDQDILNLLTSRYITQFYNISCEWNYRFFMCEKPEADKCDDAQKNGISIFHGLGHSFFNCTKAPKFCKVFSIVENYKLSTDMKQNIYEPVQDALQKITTLYKKGYRCKKSTYFNDMVMKQFVKYI